MPTADIWEQKKILRYVSFKATIAAPSLNVFVKVEKSHYLFFLVKLPTGICYLVLSLHSAKFYKAQVR